MMIEGESARYSFPSYQATWGFLTRALQVFRRYYDGQPLSQIDDLNHEMREKYASPFWDLHRVDVQRALVARAKELGVEIRLGAKVIDIDFDQTVLRLEDGELLQADLLIGADGLWSKCRERFLATKGQVDSPLPTGDLAYRIILHTSDIDDQELRDWIQNPTCQFWIGPESHVISYSIRNGETFNLVLLVPDNLPADVARQSGSVEEMRRLFAEWDPVLNRFLDQVKTVDKWKLMHRVELDNWVSDKSNFVFVGDAAHPMLPYLAQGANSSIEDGAMLGYLLAAVKSKDQLPEALQLYEHLRKRRGDKIAKEAFEQRRVLHMVDGPEQQERDAIMSRSLGQSINGKFPNRWQCPVFQPWLFGYDANEEAKHALQNSGLRSTV